MHPSKTLAKAEMGGGISSSNSISTSSCAETPREASSTSNAAAESSIKVDKVNQMANNEKDAVIPEPNSQKPSTNDASSIKVPDALNRLKAMAKERAVGASLEVHNPKQPAIHTPKVTPGTTQVNPKEEENAIKEPQKNISTSGSAVAKANEPQRTTPNVVVVTKDSPKVVVAANTNVVKKTTNLAQDRANKTPTEEVHSKPALEKQPTKQRLDENKTLKVASQPQSAAASTNLGITTLPKEATKQVSTTAPSTADKSVTTDPKLPHKEGPKAKKPPAAQENQTTTGPTYKSVTTDRKLPLKEGPKDKEPKPLQENKTTTGPTDRSVTTDAKLPPKEGPTDKEPPATQENTTRTGPTDKSVTTDPKLPLKESPKDKEPPTTQGNKTTTGPALKGASGGSYVGSVEKKTSQEDSKRKLHQVTGVVETPLSVQTELQPTKQQKTGAGLASDIDKTRPAVKLEKSLSAKSADDNAKKSIVKESDKVGLEEDPNEQARNIAPVSVTKGPVTGAVTAVGVGASPKPEAALKDTKTESTSNTENEPSKGDSELILYKSKWRMLAEMDLKRIGEMPQVREYGCSALRLHNGRRCWASMLESQAILGMYTTRQKAMRTAVCCALVLDHFKKSAKEGKPAVDARSVLDKIRPLLDTDSLDEESVSGQPNTAGPLKWMDGDVAKAAYSEIFCTFTSKLIESVPNLNLPSNSPRIGSVAATLPGKLKGKKGSSSSIKDRKRARNDDDDDDRQLGSPKKATHKGKMKKRKSKSHGEKEKTRSTQEEQLETNPLPSSTALVEKASGRAKSTDRPTRAKRAPELFSPDALLGQRAFERMQGVGSKYGLKRERPSDDYELESDNSSDVEDIGPASDGEILPDRIVDFERDIKSKPRKKIEMRDGSTGLVQRVFKNMSQAARCSGLSRSMLSTICKEGGGYLGGAHFRFLEVSEPDDVVISTVKNESLRKKKRSSPKHALLGGNRQLSSQSPPQFDMSRLLRLSRRHLIDSGTRRPVEVVCKLTGDVVVCFRNSTEAAEALGVDVARVKRACRTFGTSGQYDFVTFSLRAVDKSSAYEYGSKLSEFESSSEDEGNQDHNRRKRNDRAAKDPNESSDCEGRSTATGREIAKGNTLISPKADQLLNLFEGSVVWDQVSVPTVLNSDRPDQNDNENVCIVCQVQPAQVVFEPCLHSVVCKDCAAKSCRSFCPFCRAPISVRKMPKTVQRIRPRVYSSYSFM